MSSSNPKPNDEYDDIPVIYCKSCLSLNIQNFAQDDEEEELQEGVIGTYDYCQHCGSTNLGVCSIEEHEKLCKELYNNSQTN